MFLVSVCLLSNLESLQTCVCVCVNPTGCNLIKGYRAQVVSSGCCCSECVCVVCLFWLVCVCLNVKLNVMGYIDLKSKGLLRPPDYGSEDRVLGSSGSRPPLPELNPHLSG